MYCTWSTAVVYKSKRDLSMRMISIRNKLVFSAIIFKEGYLYINVI